ncbi:MAG: proteasome assembly chaperone family protein [Methanofastidiosum sp.]
MKETYIIEEKKDIKLENPIFVEGLPGIGLVGKLAADHLIQELKAVKFAELYSPRFPHQALVEKDSTMRLMKNEFYYYTGGKRDILFLSGDTQPPPTDAYGHYEISTTILDFVEKFGVKEMFTLGGYSTGGYPVKEPKVLGAASDVETVEKYKDKNIVFREDPGSAIVGASGLLIAMGKLRNMNGLCLLGESPGYIIDAKASKAVLQVLVDILELEINMEELDKRAEETEKALSKIQEMQKNMTEYQPLPPGNEETGYIR